MWGQVFLQMISVLLFDPHKPLSMQQGDPTMLYSEDGMFIIMCRVRPHHTWLEFSRMAQFRSDQTRCVLGWTKTVGQQQQQMQNQKIMNNALFHIVTYFNMMVMDLVFAAICWKKSILHRWSFILHSAPAKPRSIFFFNRILSYTGSCVRLIRSQSNKLLTRQQVYYNIWNWDIWVFYRCLSGLSAPILKDVIMHSFGSSLTVLSPSRSLRAAPSKSTAVPNSLKIDLTELRVPFNDFTFSVLLSAGFAEILTKEANSDL